MTTSPLLPPPLDIQMYHIHELTFRALSEYNPDLANSGGLDVDFDVERNADAPRDFRIILRIKLAEAGYTSDDNPPYSLYLAIVGYFTFAEDTPEDVMQRMINLNGTSILYGIARGLVGQATGAGVHGQFVLPAVNFVALVNARAAAQSHELSAPQSPPKSIEAPEGRPP